MVNQRDLHRVRAAVYTRISADRTGEGLGVERQEQDCRALATRLGWTVAEVYAENETSAFRRRTVTLPDGRTVRAVVRPRFRAMLDDLEAGRVDAVIAYDLDRIARDPRDLEDLIDVKESLKVEIRSVTGSLRLDNDADITMARVMVAMANKASRDTARRVARAAEQRAQQGGWHGGHAPFGYVMHGGSLVIHPEHSVWLHEAVDRVLAGETAYGVCSDWNRKHRRTPQDGPWGTRTLIRALTNPALVGKRTHKGEVIGDGSWQPLLEVEIFEQLRAVLLANEGSRPFDRVKHSTARKYPFTGLVVCSSCGNGMYRQRWKDVKDTYVCARPTRKGGQTDQCGMRINADPVDAVIRDAIFKAFDSPAVLRRLNADDGGNEKVAAARRAIADDERRLQQVDDDNYDGVLDRASWLRQRARIEERIRSSQKSLDEAAARSVVRLDGIENLRETWDSRTPDWQHTVARLIFDKVEILPQPKGVATRLSPRKTEAEDDYARRSDAHRRDVLKARVRMVRRA